MWHHTVITFKITTCIQLIKELLFSRTSCEDMSDWFLQQVIKVVPHPTELQGVSGCSPSMSPDKLSHHSPLPLPSVTSPGAERYGNYRWHVWNITHHDWMVMWCKSNAVEFQRLITLLITNTNNPSHLFVMMRQCLLV